MPCSVCGDVCHCISDASSGSRVRSRFRLEEGVSSASSLHRASVLIDPEADDGCEQKFAASLDETSASPRFVLDRPLTSELPVSMEDSSDDLLQSGADGGIAAGTAETCHPRPDFSPGLLPTDLLDSSGSSVWKQEVAARLSSYRARRKPRPPKYPSLRLKFEPVDPARNVARSAEPISSAAVQSPGSEYEPLVSSSQSIAPEASPRNPVFWEAEAAPVPEKARVIEFPRAYVPPVPSPDELAEAITDRPRILEVPDVEPPPPALGGILLQTVEKEPEKRPGFEIPLQAASLPRRIGAAAVDGLLVLSACAVFGYIAFRLAPFIPPVPQLVTLGVLIAGIFWAGYQYLLLVYTGATPGLRAAHLQLSDFDGSAVPRSRRRWRVIASMLSGLSLGLGLAWCFLDEDALCWHDRITHTYLAPSK